MNIGIEWILGLVATIVLTIIGLLINQKEKAEQKVQSDVTFRLDKAEDNLKKHEDKCNEIPKAVVIQKLENLCEKQDEYHRQATDNFNKLSSDLESVKKKTDQNSDTLIRLVTKEELRK